MLMSSARIHGSCRLDTFQAHHKIDPVESSWISSAKPMVIPWVSGDNLVFVDIVDGGTICIDGVTLRSR